MSPQELQVAVPYSLSSLDTVTKAVETAEIKFRAVMMPYVDQLFKRTQKIFKRLCYIVNMSLRMKKAQNKIFHLPVSNSTGGYHQLHQQQKQQEEEDSDSCSLDQNDTFFSVNQMYNDAILGKRLKYSSPQLSFCVKDHYYQCAKTMIKLAKAKCMEDIQSPRLVYFPTLLTNESMRSSLGFILGGSPEKSKQKNGTPSVTPYSTPVGNGKRSFYESLTPGSSPGCDCHEQIPFHLTISLTSLTNRALQHDESLAQPFAIRGSILNRLALEACITSDCFHHRYSQHPFATVVAG